MKTKTTKIMKKEENKKLQIWGLKNEIKVYEHLLNGSPINPVILRIRNPLCHANSIKDVKDGINIFYYDKYGAIIQKCKNCAWTKVYGIDCSEENNVKQSKEEWLKMRIKKYKKMLKELEK